MVLVGCGVATCVSSPVGKLCRHVGGGGGWGEGIIAGVWHCRNVCLARV